MGRFETASRGGGSSDVPISRIVALAGMLSTSSNANGARNAGENAMIVASRTSSNPIQVERASGGRMGRVVGVASARSSDADGDVAVLVRARRDPVLPTTTARDEGATGVRP